MDPAIYIDLVSADPVAATKSALRFVHFIGLACGLGAATLLDILLVKFFVRRKITEESWEIFHSSTVIVNIGLIILWVTGIGFMVHYALFDPVLLTNDKIWAKLGIVTILTLNGLFLHTVVMPRMERQVGRGLFEGMDLRSRSIFIVCGAISAVSWYVPVVLGAFSQLNFVVSATMILATYAVLIFAAALAMMLTMNVMMRDRSTDDTTAAVAA
jgi:hypothetical protein